MSSANVPLSSALGKEKKKKKIQAAQNARSQMMTYSKHFFYIDIHDREIGFSSQIQLYGHRERPHDWVCFSPLISAVLL